MHRIRIGIVGLGGMGSHYFAFLEGAKVSGACVRAVCDVDPARLQWAREQKAEGPACFNDVDAFMQCDGMDAVLVATPHFLHPPVAMKALETGRHVLIEKPAGVYTKQVRLMNEAAAAAGKVFAIMFNCRTLPSYRKIRDLVDSGETGQVRRINWIVTDWFRTQAYFESGGWRATWAGEGGGALLNQCPHQLDLWQWICGMPKRIRAFCAFGKYHDIEVEDDVTAYLEYENGATGVFVTSTGEAPGTNRLEIVGDRGTVVLDRSRLTFHRNRQPMNAFLRESSLRFSAPECWTIDLTPGAAEAGHDMVVQNWIDAIRKGTPLIAPGPEGIRSLELSNAMLLSAWTDRTVDLPVDEDLFWEMLQEKIRTSGYRKKTARSGEVDLSGSFHKA